MCAPNLTSAVQSIIWVALCFCCCSTQVTWAQSWEGFTEPCETVQIAAPEPGIVDEVRVEQGQTVRRGDVICLLDMGVLTATLKSAEARAATRGRLASAEAALELRERRYRKMNALLDQGHASPEEIERAATDLQIARAAQTTTSEDARQNELEVERVQAQIERRTIRSPIDGVVVQLFRNSGEYTASNNAVIATLVKLDKLRVRYYLPTQVAARLESQQQVTLRLAETGRTARGWIDFISPVTDSDSGTVRVEVLIDNAAAEYRSGVPCVLEIDELQSHHRDLSRVNQ